MATAGGLPSCSDTRDAVLRVVMGPRKELSLQSVTAANQWQGGQPFRPLHLDLRGAGHPDGLALPLVTAAVFLAPVDAEGRLRDARLWLHRSSRSLWSDTHESVGTARDTRGRRW